METKYYKVVNCSNSSVCATVFDEKVDIHKQIEIRELLRMNEYKMIEITKEEYNQIPRKLDAIWY